MADINKTIQISYRAEVQNLVNGLKKVGNVSEREAKKLVNDLDKAYSKAAREAQKSARKQERALKRVAKTAKKSSMDIRGDFASIAAGAAAAAVAVLAFGQHIADMSNQLVDASAKTGVAVDTLNGLRLAAEGSGLSFEDLEMGLIRLPQMMHQAASGSKKAQKAFKDLGVQTTKTVDGMQKLRSADEVLKDLFDSLQKIESAEEKAARAAEIFGRQAGPKFIQSGAIDNLDAFVRLAENFGVSTGPAMTSTMADFQRVSATAYSVITGEVLRLIDTLMGGSGGAGKGLTSAILSVTEGVIFLGSIYSDVFGTIIAGGNLQIAALNMLIQGFIGSTEDASRAQQVFNEQLDVFTNKASGLMSGTISRAQGRLKDFRKDLEATMSGAAGGAGGAGGEGGAGGAGGAGAGSRAPKVKKEVDELADANALLLDLERDIQRSLEKSIDRRIESLSGEEKIIAVRDREIERLQEVKKLLDEATSKEIERLEAKERTAEEEQKLDELFSAFAVRTVQIDQEIANAKIDAENELFELKVKHAETLGGILDEHLEKEQESIDKAMEAQAALGFMVSSLGMGFETAAQLVEQFGDKDRESQEMAFNIRKTSAIADVLISTAQNVAAVAPLGPIAMGAMTAVGAAQMAIIAAQQPKFHMGGMISGSSGLAPDEKSVIVKNGEAILDSSTVDRIGGEQGVRDLQNNGSSPQFIVMNPFKHYDRFMTDRQRAGISARSSRRGY